MTRDRFTKSILRDILEARMRSGWSNYVQIPSPPHLPSAIRDYAERLAAGAIQNLQDYFARLPISGYTVGGKRATLQPLLYLKGRLLPSAEDIGSIGEGIAGYYLEDEEQLDFEVRPFGVSPDFIFRDPNLNRMILVEVKTSLHQGRFPMTTAISLMEILAKTKFIRKGSYAAYVIQVDIRGTDDFEVRRLAMEEV